MIDPDRSYAKLREKDLERLADLARLDRATFFIRNRSLRRYPKRVLAVALCQGAARHFCDGETGVKDFDVWTFYAKGPSSSRFPFRRRIRRDSELVRFGVHHSRPNYIGRPVDFLWRLIPPVRGSIESVVAYLQLGETETARELSAAPVVVLEPRDHLGHVIWQPHVVTHE